MKQSPIITIIVAVVFLAGGFFADMKYQQMQATKASNASTGFGSQNQFGRGGRTGGLRPTTGEVISTDSTSLTVKLQDGSSKIVILSEKTQINKAEAAMKSDIKTGMRVAVFGTDNSDGSVTAQSVQLNPELGRMGGRQP